MAKRQPSDNTPERKDVIKNINAQDKRGQKLGNETISAYERARREILGIILAADDSPLTILHLQRILIEVQDRLDVLYKELGPLYRTTLASEVQTEAEIAMKEVGKLKITEDARSYLRIMSPRIPHDMVENMITGSLEHIKAVNDDLTRRIRGELTQSMIRGESTQKAAKRILGEGLTNEGIKPVFPTVHARAMAIARTEMSTAANTAHVETYKELAKQLPTLQMRWVSAMCSRTCDRCRSYHNDKTKPGDAFPISGLSCPPAHPRCLCRVVAEVP